MAATLQAQGCAFVDALTDDLIADAEPSVLAGRVDHEALIEYYVRAGRRDETGALIEAMLSTYQSRGREYFAREVHRLRRDGLPERETLGAHNGLAYLVVQFDLPVRLG